MADTSMIGRERELGVVQSFLAIPTEPGALVLEGSAGIGKTTLWNAGVALARADGYGVLMCRPAAAESQLSFAAVADLLAEVLEEALPSLPAPQRRALEVALLLEHADGPAPGVRAIAGGFLGVVRHTAARGPLLVAIDDAQWIDEPSRAVLEFALRRLSEEDVRLLVSRRGCDEVVPLGLGRVLPPGRLERLSLTSLSMGAVHRLLQDRLGVALSRPMLRRLHAESDGNPFYALELARALQRRSSTPRPDQPLPVPDVLQRLVQERVSALPDDVTRLLELVASLFDRRVSDVRVLAAEYGLTGAIDGAINAGVLALDGQRLEFTHPLLATGVYAAIGPERRHALHRRLADLGGRDEARALHLTLAVDTPDAEIAAELERSSLRARARGATDTAGRLAESAAGLTPLDSSDVGARRLIAAADHFLVAGDPAHGRELLRGLVDRLPAGPVRAEALSLLSWAAPENADLELAARLGEQALSEAGDEPQLEATIRLRLAVIEEIRGHLDARAEHHQIAVDLAEHVGEPALLASALSGMGYTETLRGARVVSESYRAVEIERSLPEFLGQYAPSISLGQVLMYTDQLDQARTVLREVLERATVAGHEDARATCLFHLADLERRAGNWEVALRLSDETRELNSQAGNEQEYASSLIVGALLDAGMGRVEQAREAALTGLAAAERMGDQTFTVHHRGVLGFLELSVGDAQAAQQWLRPATDSLLRQGVGELSVYPVVQNEIDAAVEAGNLDRAEHLVAHLERLADETGRAWTRAVACRGRGSIQAALGELDAARVSLAAALDAHESVPQPFERARSLLVLGRIERRAKRKRASREALEQAAAIFAALPAPLWTAKVDGEIARLGLRSAPEGLTETEARIAELAAGGMTNPEIAAAAFVSRKTVEANLSKVYRKLGVRSRVELARRLPAPDEAYDEAASGEA